MLRVTRCSTALLVVLLATGCAADVTAPAAAPTTNRSPAAAVGIRAATSRRDSVSTIHTMDMPTSVAACDSTAIQHCRDQWPWY